MKKHYQVKNMIDDIYKINKDRGCIIPCDCCGSEVATCFFEKTFAVKERYLCEFCASTSVANLSLGYREFTAEDFAKVMGQTVNFLLKKLIEKGG
jgi:hypothetical protein